MFFYSSYVIYVSLSLLSSTRMIFMSVNIRYFTIIIIINSLLSAMLIALLITFTPFKWISSFLLLSKHG